MEQTKCREEAVLRSVVAFAALCLASVPRGNAEPLKIRIACSAIAIANGEVDPAILQKNVDDLHASGLTKSAIDVKTDLHMSLATEAAKRIATR
jgi:hypothetical protein